MNNSPPRGHPLHVASTNDAAVSNAVTVLDISREHVSDRLDPAVRMPGKPRQIIRRNVVAEIVEQQERIEIGSVAKTERTPQMYPRAFECRFGFYEPVNGSDGHKTAFIESVPRGPNV